MSDVRERFESFRQETFGNYLRDKAFSITDMKEAYESADKSRDEEVQRLEADLQEWKRKNHKHLRSSRKFQSENKIFRNILWCLTVNESHWKHCPNCPDQGWFVGGVTDEPEQIQCEFCYTEQWSVFNQTRIKQSLKDGE